MRSCERRLDWRVARAVLPRYLMSPERPAVVHGMPARYLASEGLQKIGSVGSASCSSGGPARRGHACTPLDHFRSRARPADLGNAGPPHDLCKMLIVVVARPHGETLAYREPTSSDCEDRDRAGRWDRERLIGG